MEVTNVSPSPASSTEGDHLCETDVTTMAIHSVTLLICLCGLAGNGAVIGLLSLKSRNSGFFDLAVIDFFFLLFVVTSALLILVEDVSCSPILPELYLSFLFQFSVVSLYWGLLWVIDSSDVWYMNMLFWLCYCWEPPQRLVRVVDSVKHWTVFALFTVIPTVTFLCPSHQQEHCRAALISMNTLILLLLAVPVAISSAVDFIKAKRGSQQEQLQRRDIVTFLIVLFTLLLSLFNFLQQLGYMAVPSQVVFLLACIHNSIKPFIYFLLGRCWRPFSIKSLQLSLQRVFEEPEENSAHSDDPAMDTMV